MIWDYLNTLPKSLVFSDLNFNQDYLAGITFRRDSPLERRELLENVYRIQNEHIVVFYFLVHDILLVNNWD